MLSKCLLIMVILHGDVHLELRFSKILASLDALLRGVV